MREENGKFWLENQTVRDIPFRAILETVWEASENEL